VKRLLDARFGGHDSLWSRAGDTRIKVAPVRITLFDKPDLPGTIPFLQLFFPLNCRLDIAVLFEVDQSIDMISFGEAFGDAFSMLVDPPYKIIRHADIQRAADLAGLDVNPVAAVFGHIANLAFTGSSAFADDDAKQGAAL
jgi:hypothetical protein